MIETTELVGAWCADLELQTWMAGGSGRRAKAMELLCSVVVARMLCHSERLLLRSPGEVRIVETPVEWAQEDTAHEPLLLTTCGDAWSSSTTTGVKGTVLGFLLWVIQALSLE